MSAIGKIKASRVNNQTANTFVGESGSIFYNVATGALRLSNGTTPGGLPVTVAIVGNVTFGNLSVTDTTISTLAPDAELNLVTSGSGNINLVGNLDVHTTSQGIGGMAVMSVSNDGQVSIFVTNADPQAGAVKIVGTSTQTFYPPLNSGVMIHLTGQLNDPTRLYNDGVGNFAAYVGRRLNGNVMAPTQVLSGQDIMRISATGYNGNTIPGTASSRITFLANETFTSTNFGGNILFSACPITSNVLANIAYINGSGLTVTSNIAAGNINITGNGTIVGHYTHETKNAGVIADAGTLTLDFVTDDIVKCIWGNGMTVAYANLIPGRSVRLLATKSAGTGNDTLNLGTILANQTSTGSTTITVSADTTYIVEFYSSSANISGLYANLL